jgi:hypothetical protein
MIQGHGGNIYEFANRNNCNGFAGKVETLKQLKVAC